jgi:hypothetical protein
LIFGGGFFILLAERGVVPKEGLWMVPLEQPKASIASAAEDRKLNTWRKWASS